MRTRLVLGGLAAALALGTTVAPAQAAPRPACADGFEILCTVIGLTCVVTGEYPCHP